MLFLGLFYAASLTVFGFMYCDITRFASHGMDSWLRTEMASRTEMHSSERMRQLNARPVSDPEGRRPIALFDAEGRWLAGSPATLPTTLPPMDEPFEFVQQRGDEVAPFRGQLHRLG